MITTFKTHDVQSVSINAPLKKVFAYIADPSNLPHWTKAFHKADARTAVLITPQGELLIELRTISNPDSGTIDWHMTMPDGSVGKAYSRVLEGAAGETIYAFVLLAPPLPLELVEGALQQQMMQLEEELHQLQTILGE